MGIPESCRSVDSVEGIVCIDEQDAIRVIVFEKLSHRMNRSLHSGGLTSAELKGAHSFLHINSNHTQNRLANYSSQYFTDQLDVVPDFYLKGFLYSPE